MHEVEVCGSIAVLFLREHPQGSGVEEYSHEAYHHEQNNLARAPAGTGFLGHSVTSADGGQVKECTGRPVRRRNCCEVRHLRPYRIKNQREMSNIKRSAICISDNLFGENKPIGPKHAI